MKQPAGVAHDAARRFRDRQPMRDVRAGLFLVERLQLIPNRDALIELAFAIATSQVFPVLKRALGYAVSCSRVSIEVSR